MLLVANNEVTCELSNCLENLGLNLKFWNSFSCSFIYLFQHGLKQVRRHVPCTIFVFNMLDGREWTRQPTIFITTFFLLIVFNLINQTYSTFSWGCFGANLSSLPSETLVQYNVMNKLSG